MVEFTEEIKNTIHEIGSFNHDSNPEGLSSLYDDIALKYDKAMITMGHPDPQKCADLLEEIHEGLNHEGRPTRDDTLILDMGCGTGLTGQAIIAKGFPHVHGLDASQGMLAVA